MKRRAAPQARSPAFSAAGAPIYFRVRVEGRAAHAGQANRDINPIVKTMPVVAALEQLGAGRALEMRHPLINVGGGQSCHLNIGTMRGGEWPSSIPGSAVIGCRIGFVLGEPLVEARWRVPSRRRLRRSVARSALSARRVVRLVGRALAAGSGARVRQTDAIGGDADDG